MLHSIVTTVAQNGQTKHASRLKVPTSLSSLVKFHKLFLSATYYSTITTHKSLERGFSSAKQNPFRTPAQVLRALHTFDSLTITLHVIQLKA